MESLSRRGFVRLLGGAAGVGLLPLNFGCAEGDAYVQDSGYRPTPEAPFTPVDQWYVNYCCGLPDVKPPAKWRVRVRGLVRNTLDLSFADLMALPQVTREVTLECVGNRPSGHLISAGRFEGVRLRDVLGEAGVSGRARGLRFAGLDGYPSLVPAALGDDEVPILAHTLNGEPLPPLLGAPVRVLLPGRYGLFSVKWLDSITLTREFAQYGAFRGLSANIGGETPVRSRIDWPGDGRTVTVDREVELYGLAVTAGVGVARVEVRVDGAWQPAELTFNTLDDERSPYLWSLWRLRWTPRRRGRQVLSVRAFDAEGRTQSAEAEWPYDSGAVHSVRVIVV